MVASSPAVALTIGPGSAMADQMHANKAKFAGAGKYANEIIALYLGKTAERGRRSRASGRLVPQVDDPAFRSPAAFANLIATRERRWSDCLKVLAGPWRCPAAKPEADPA